MAALSRNQTKRRLEALELVASPDPLTEEQKRFVLTHYHSDPTTNGLHGAYFTPLELAGELSLLVPDRGRRPQRILDACAGIGGLAFASRNIVDVRCNGAIPREFVCVEANPEYVRVGKKIMPEALWVCADILDLPTLGLGSFDTVISNPPFGTIDKAGKNSPRYQGRRFEYHVIDVVADYISSRGAFIIPQGAAPFRHSGQRHWSLDIGDVEYDRFVNRTGIALGPSFGIDTSLVDGQWSDGVSPRTEVVVVDYRDWTDPRPASRGEAPELGAGAASQAWLETLGVVPTEARLRSPREASSDPVAPAPAPVSAPALALFDL